MEEAAQVAVITVPFPGQGHLNQLLQISYLISSYNIPVYYVGSAVHNRQARARTSVFTSQHLAKINFHDIQAPPFAAPPPNPNSSSKFPLHLQPAWCASLNLRQPVAAFLNDVAGKFRRIVIIHDSMMAAVVQDFCSIPNAESYALSCISAHSLMSYPTILNPKAISSVAEDDVPDEIKHLVAAQSEPMSYRSGDLYNSCRLIESPYLEVLEREEIVGNRKSWAIGPILPADIDSALSRHESLEWLDKQEPNSVIYVAFGSTVSLSDEEIAALAFGLEQSRVKFLWVLKDADKGDIFDEQVRRAEVPEGFEERVKGVGMVVRDWAPQPQILAHKSTGGFMSHCGWNSSMEGITMGVPIAAWPMHSEQPKNTELITDVLKVGLVVREWAKRKEPIKASDIENVVRQLMASEEGDAIRKRAEEIGATVRQATQPGGASRLELDSFVAHITR